jgi:hypothetical protein
LEYGGRQRDWKVTSVTAPQSLDVEVKEGSRGGLLATKYYLTVKLKPDTPAGELAEIITLQTNDPAAAVIRIHVSGFVQSPLTLTPGQHNFGRVTVGKEVTRNVIARSTVGNFQLEPIPEFGDGLAITALGESAPVHVLSVKFTPTKAGLYRKEVPIKTLAGAKATLVIEAEVVNP